MPPTVDSLNEANNSFTFVFSQVSRGSANSKTQSLGSLKWHLEKVHPDINLDSAGPSQNEPSSSSSGTGITGKRSSGEICIWSCRSKVQRTALYQSSIPEWIAPKTMLGINSPKAQKYHRSIFERIVLDLAPFHEVNKPGFLRNFALLAPNFEVSTNLLSFKPCLRNVSDRAYLNL